MTGVISHSSLPIKLIGASAGTGKTHRLACAFVDAVLGKSGPPIEPTKILAVTFTNKAADELLERIRHIFLENGRRDYARQAGSAYIGTVNSICGRLLKEHAFEAGMSPVMNVIPPEEVSNILAMATDRTVDALADEIEDVAHRLSFVEWKEVVEEIISLARANVVPLSNFEQCSVKSWESLQLLLPAPSLLSAEQLDEMLLNAIDTAIANLESVGDDTATTKTATNLLKEKRSALRSGRLLAWNEWAQLSKLKVGKASTKSVQPVLASASNHAMHPRLQMDVRQFIAAIFKCSAHAIEEYESFKRLHGFVDFTDQEFLTLELLDQAPIRDNISEKIELVLVDEFQDTSPIQLAIFSKIAALVTHSLWVGDEKQAIYGFRGTDPELMNGVVSSLEGSHADREQLEKSYRSRPSLIEFTNSVFGMSFESVGIAKKRVHIADCERIEHQEQRKGLVACHLQGKTANDAAGSIAEFVEEVLMNSASWLVENKSSGELRPISGHDIAILCRTNERCESVANALSLRDIKSACQQNGLLQTTECTLAFAALRYLVDRNDSLAMAEILHLTENGDRKYEWFVEWLAKDREQMRAASHPLVSLDQARVTLMEATPLEALETAICASKVVDFAKRWGNARARLSNVDALRGLAMRYEDVCMSQRRAATPAGLVAFLFRDVAAGGEKPPSLDNSAVHVLTYHAAKGLEFPMVILLDLDTPKEPSPFGTFAQTAGGIVDARNPLKDRWIRFWPWPYGQQRKNVTLDSTVDSSSEMKSTRKRDRAESMRLLYVGATRARDYIVVGCSKDTGWLDSLTDINGTRVLKVPTEEGQHFLTIGSSVHEVTVDVRKPVTPGRTLTKKPTVTYAFPDAQIASKFLPLRTQPSSLPLDDVGSSSNPNSVRIHNIGSRIPLNGTADMQAVGDVMHAFLAADPGKSRAQEERHELARRILAQWNVSQLEPQSLIEASDRLTRFIEETYPLALLSRECSVFGNIEGQRVRGRIDLLVETEAGIVIIDHKTFPGAFDHWTVRAGEYRPQLAMYAKLASCKTGLPLRNLLVHLPIVGAIVDVTWPTIPAS